MSTVTPNYVGKADKVYDDRETVRGTGRLSVTPLNFPPDLAVPTPDWMWEGNCLSVGVAPFYPEPQPGRPNTKAAAEALATCKGCPVIEECFLYAMRNREEWGVWGGTTQQQRRAKFRELDAGATLPCRNGCGRVFVQETRRATHERELCPDRNRERAA